MYRAGFEPARFLRTRFTVWRFQPLTHRYLLKLAGAVGIEPTSVCFGGRLAAEDMDPYLEKNDVDGARTRKSRRERPVCSPISPPRHENCVVDYGKSWLGAGLAPADFLQLVFRSATVTNPKSDRLTLCEPYVMYFWCGRWDLNPQPKLTLHGFLRPACLPFHHNRMAASPGLEPGVAASKAVALPAWLRGYIEKLTGTHVPF